MSTTLSRYIYDEKYKTTTLVAYDFSDPDEDKSWSKEDILGDDPDFLDDFNQMDLRKLMILLRRFFMIYKVSNFENRLNKLRKDG